MVAHAKRELKAIGYDVNEGADKFAEVLSGDGDDMNNAMADNILELLTVFAGQGHSGASAGYAIDLFTKLAKFKPLKPLTGKDDEWVDVSESNGSPMWQNNRCSHVFKDDDHAWDIEARIFTAPDGYTYTDSDSRGTIKFPYTPERKYFNVDDDGKILSEYEPV